MPNSQELLANSLIKELDTLEIIAVEATPHTWAFLCLMYANLIETAELDTEEKQLVKYFFEEVLTGIAAASPATALILQRMLNDV